MSQVKNKILIITAPSGAGKTSITRHLMQVFSQLAFSVSAATRKPRGNEQDGVDYYFITPEEFQEKIRLQEFAEWEMVYEGKYYGTLKKELERIWKNDQVPVLDIDVKGAIHVKQQYPDSTCTLFIVPPSVEALRNRLVGRGTETEETLQARLNKASYELSFKDQFDFRIVNDQLDIACLEAEKTVASFLQR